MDDLTSYEAEAVKGIAYHRKKLEEAIQDALDNGLEVTVSATVDEGVSIVIEVKKPIELPE